jgi:predicted ATP-dependent serine protease
MKRQLSCDRARFSTTQNEKENKAEEPLIRFFTPSELCAYMPEANTVLVGDSHISKGEVMVLGGEPGIGKSTAATELAPTLCFWTRGTPPRKIKGLPSMRAHSTF